MIYYPSDNIALRNRNKRSVFLAGTIDNGNSENWQEKIANDLVYDFDIFNPRRKDWDQTWQQDPNNQNLRLQIKWELKALEAADIIIMNFLDSSQSPISLFEAGLYAKSKKIYICCSHNYCRSANVYVSCEEYDIPLFENMFQLLAHIRLLK